MSPRSGFCDASDVLVRRFVLFDIVSGLTAASPSQPSVVRYASNVTLTVEIQRSPPSRIYPPVLTIKYAEANPSAWSSSPLNAIQGYSFKAIYTMDTTAFDTSLFQAFIVAVVLTGLLFMLRVSNWNKRNTRIVSTVGTTTDLGGVNVAVLR